MRGELFYHAEKSFGECCIASLIIRMEQEHMYQGVDISTTYHAFVSRLDINIWSLLDNVQVNKRANGGVGLR